MVKQGKRLISYLRVSTRRQGLSGLGLDAQRELVASYAEGIGATIEREFVETESGRKSDRPELRRAIGRTRAIRGVLCIAKLDRLSRDVEFIAHLMNTDVDLVFADMPEANRLTLHVLAAVAEHEARLISERTKAALAQAKRRGVLLGSKRPGHREHWKRGCQKGARLGLPKAIKRAAENRAKRREELYADLKADVQMWRDAGASYATIARRLNERGDITTSGCEFKAMTVKRILAEILP
jgi:DNA invertase Pin-like site-specific DNA recombinase